MLFSLWLIFFSVQGQYPTGYCSSGPTTTLDSDVGQVYLRGISTAIDDQTGCPGRLGVADYTDQVADVSIGSTFTLLYTLITCGNQFPNIAGGWIDFDRNGFYEDKEQIFTSVDTYGNAAINFTVPIGAELGLTRMRIQIQEAIREPQNPCADFRYGGTKDFGINIVPAGFPAEYCDSGPVTQLDSDIGPVYLKGLTQTIDDQTGCPGRIGVVDDTNEIADVNLGGTFTLIYTLITCGNQFPNLAGGWIDFNHNGLYESTEKIFSSDSKYGQMSIDFTVPYDAVLGLTRMRIQIQEAATEPQDPCANFRYGGTKDFGINIVPGNFPTGYCASGPATILDSDIGPVYLEGLTQTIDDQTGCPGRIGVVDDTNEVADVNPGGTFTLTYTLITCGNQFPNIAAGWIDFNRNNVYESSEQIFSSIGKYGQASVKFVVPKDAEFGLTRMRIQIQEGTQEPQDPCADFRYGGTKDFGINIVPQPQKNSSALDN